MHIDHARGFGLPMTLFILVILSFLAAALYRMAATETIDTAQEVVAVRALLAAETGRQLQLRDWRSDANHPPICRDKKIEYQTAGLQNCHSIVHCQAQTRDGKTTYMATSTGRCEIGVLSAERTASLLFETGNNMLVQ